MEFTLYYKGILKSNGNKNHKHELRMKFHEQIKKLWDQEPLKYFKNSVNLYDNSVARQIGHFNFCSIINTSFHLVAEIDITILRSESIGNIITSGGDIDNRIKTLLDALKMPLNQDELPEKLDYIKQPNPTFCLLQDDSLISSLKISTKQLLTTEINKKEVILVIDITTRRLSTMMGGMEFP